MPSKHDVLRDVFGFDSFRPGQEGIVDCLAGNRHVLAVMPTGSGKSLCYQVPALVKGGLTIVVSPLVALMQDQVSALRLAGVPAATINSAASRDENVDIWREVARGNINILYLAPERLMTERMISALQRLDVRLIAVDEAHCISQWGASFRPEYEALHGLRDAFPGVPIGAFTATADKAAREDIVRKLFGGEADVYVSGFDRPNIALTVEPKANGRRQLEIFLQKHRGESGIVYALSRKSTEEIAEFLSGKGYRAVPYHAGLSAAQRSETQDLFMTEKGVIVCATIAFGMGIDKPDVRFVFHADLPSSLDAYYQEIGRAGRDGKPASAHMVFGLGDIRTRRTFIDDSDASDEHKRREHQRLNALVAFCEASSCRRISLLAYFGEDSEPCGNCDICRNPAATIDGAREARIVCEAVRDTGERFGAVHVVDVISGKSTERVTALGHDRIAAFGSGKSLQRAEWQSLLRQMVSAGLLIHDSGGFGGISLSGKGRALLNGEGKFNYRRDTLRSKAKRDRGASSMPETSGDPEQEALLARLKALRRRLANERQVPAYVVFSDRTLIDMASRAPLNRRAFAEVHGIGASKLEEFSAIFLREIVGFVRERSSVG